MEDGIGDNLPLDWSSLPRPALPLLSPSKYPYDHTLTVPRAVSVPARFRNTRTLGRLRKVYRPCGGRERGSQGSPKDSRHPTD